MQTYKLICADLDATLLNSEMTISEENEKAIQALAEQGVHFVPNTGRTFKEIPETIRSNPHIRHIIYSDGAAIYDKETDSTDGCFLPRALYLRILDLLNEYESLSTVRTGGISFLDERQFNVECMNYHQVGKYYQDFIFATNVPVKNFDSFSHTIDNVEMICTFFHDDRDCEECVKRIEEIGGTMIVSSMVHNIEILSEHAGKGTALLRLADRLGIDQKETIAVGDSKNDCDMLRAASLGIAVKNAWPELKEVADTVADCTNDEHIASYLLKNYFA